MAKAEKRNTSKVGGRGYRAKDTRAAPEPIKVRGTPEFVAEQLSQRMKSAVNLYGSRTIDYPQLVKVLRGVQKELKSAQRLKSVSKEVAHSLKIETNQAIAEANARRNTIKAANERPLQAQRAGSFNAMLSGAVNSPDPAAIRIGSAPKEPPAMSPEEAQARATSLRARIEGSEKKGALWGNKPLTVAEDPKIKGGLGRMAEATTPGESRSGARAAIKAARAQQKAAGTTRTMARGGLGAAGLYMLYKALAGQKESIDPGTQAMMMQQMMGGGMGGEGGPQRKDLVDVGRLLSIMKSIQGMTGMQGPVSQGPLI